jgi:GNAT superfamily N-acetyltransferase
LAGWRDQNVVRSPGLFCDVDLAAEIERAESELMAACSEAARESEPRSFSIEVAGGFGTYAGAESPFTKLAGLGFGGVPSGSAMDEVEAAFAAVGVPVQAELSTLAEREVGAVLVDRGYRLVSFENVLGRALVKGGAAPELPSGITVEPAGDDVATWLEVVAEGTMHADDQGLAAHEEFPREEIERADRQLLEAGELPFLARLDGRPAGGGSVRIAGRVAQLGGAATAAAYRRRGVQSALIATRLHLAAEAGCEIAVVTTQPGSRSQQNVQRFGFELLYARAVLVKAASGTLAG